MKRYDNVMGKKSIPFEFVLERISRLKPYVRPMFGCHAVYVGEKIVLILRDKDSHPRDNGVWIATYPEHHASLREIFPSLRSIEAFGPGETSWQNLPVDADDFESKCEEACDLLLLRDPRIGRIPGVKKKAKKRA